MGRYVTKQLLAGERVLYETRLHWVVFLSRRALSTVWVGPLFDYLTSEFAVTNKRVIVKVGWITRSALEMSLNRVESIGVEQGLAGRLLGYGSVTINGTGGTREAFHNIRDPLAFRRACLALL